MTKKNDLSGVSRSLSASSKAAIRRLQKHAVAIDAILAGHLQDATDDRRNTKPAMIQSLITSEAIALDKQLAALRCIRDLEQTVGDTVEATFIIIEEDPATGARRVVGVPPELEGTVPVDVSYTGPLRG